MTSPLMNALVRRFTQPGVILVAIVLTGVMGLIGGFRQLQSQIFAPFEITPPANQGVAGSDLAQFQDTDQDGLIDSQEQQLGTNPFNPDSDSDGITDGQEVTNGTDPNCLAGTDCSAWQASGSVVSPTPPPDDSAVEQPADTTAIDMTPQQLRDALIQGGLPADQVSSLTDEQLQQAWQAALQQVQ